MGHVSWLIACLIKRVLQLGPVTLLLREHEVQEGNCHYKKGGVLHERLRLQKKKNSDQEVF